jgi:hypothetical protein
VNYVACCSDLENLIAKRGRDEGLGLMMLIDKTGPRFILEYRKDWTAPVAEAGLLIKFCPYCGSELRRLLGS